MKKYINGSLKYSLLALLLVCSCQLTFTSCHDNEEGMGTPEITGVRVPDPEKADSLFTKSGPGQIIAIIGNNLANVMKVYINDQEVYFNPTMNTAHSVIVTVPTEADGFKLTAFDSSLKDEIRVETSHGTAVYSFKITAPSPSITRLQASYPRQTGDELYVYGINLVDIEKIYFTDITAEQLDTTVWTTVGGNQVAVSSFKEVSQDHHLNTKTQAYETTSVLSLTIPNISYDSGTLVVETAAGIAYIPYYKVPGMPTITSLSSDMPEIGETVTIKGTEFVQVSAITYGDVTLSTDEFTVSDTEDEITFVFQRKPSEGSSTSLAITTPGGTVSEHFFDYSCLLVDFDGRGIDNGWGPNASYLTATSSEVPYTSDGLCARINVTESQQWWGTMVYFRNSWNNGGVDPFVLPSYDVIPADASTDDIYLAVEVYNNNSDYNNGTFGGYIRYFLQKAAEDPVAESNQYDNFAWEDYNAGTFSFPLPVLGDIDGDTPTGKWYRHVLPLSKFGMFAGRTYKDVVETGINQIRLQSINQSVTTGKIDVFFDNIRLYYKK